MNHDPAKLTDDLLGSPVASSLTDPVSQNASDFADPSNPHLPAEFIALGESGLLIRLEGGVEEVFVNLDETEPPFDGDGH